jgi:hypothetical protein
VVARAGAETKFGLLASTAAASPPRTLSVKRA